MKQQTLLPWQRRSLCLLPLLSACSGSADDSVSEVVTITSDLTSAEAQCGGGWEVQDVERYDGTLGVSQDWLRARERPVGYAIHRGCSGTLIADDLFLSAGHCNHAAGDTVRFNYQNDADGRARRTSDFTVTGVVEAEDSDDWDYAILRLAGNPNRTFGAARLASEDPAPGENVVIVQHPSGVPKVVHAGRVRNGATALGENWFAHEVDTKNGTSGSGVLSLAGNVIGIHTHDGCEDAVTQGNHAIRMSRLMHRSPTLRRLGTPATLCRPSLTSSHAGWSGSAASAYDGSIATGFESRHNDWQFLQVDLGCAQAFDGLRRYMSNRQSASRRGEQGESVSYSLDGSTWTQLLGLTTTGWSAYANYRPHTWHSVPYGWSSWLRPRATVRARQVRFHWDGDTDLLNEVELDAGRSHALVAVHSNKCIDVPNGSSQPGVDVQQFTCHGGNNQRWELRLRADGQAKILALNSGLCLDVEGGSASAGARVQQFTCHDGPNQLWRIQQRSSGSYELSSAASGLCLEVPASSTADGVVLRQAACSGGAGQSWRAF